MDTRAGYPKNPLTRGYLKPLALVSGFMIASVFLSSCNLIKQLSGGSTPGGASATIGTGAGGQGGPGKAPTQPPAQNTSKAPAPQASGGGAGPMNGYWKMAFQVNDKVLSAHFRVTQDGNAFSGEGTDDHNSKSFVIEQGQIHGSKVVFYKRYDSPNNKMQTPVEYEGTLDLSQNPYMQGKYVVAMQGKEISGQWEAQKDSGGSGGDSASTQQQTQQPPPQQPPQPAAEAKPEKEPDLSGKWQAGYEYRFKTIQGTMWIEQHKDKLKGHGIDSNTGEKFTIKKGWYYYPKVTMVRHYPRIKGLKGVIEEHEMTFKGQVEWVKDAGFWVPYMQGKTDGGGAWEAQLVR